jgi:preprotein translocase subunit SecD
MNHYAGWKNALIAVFLFISALYALPNIFGSDLSVQISSTGENPITESDAEKVESILRKENIQAKSVDMVNRRVLVRFNDSETQLNAKEVLKEGLGRNYVTALNLAPAIPNWLSSLGGKAMSLGLDLRGGVHFLLEVDMNEVVRMANDRYYNELRNLLREERLYKRIKIANQSLNVEYKTSDAKLKGDELVRKDLPDLVIKDNVESNSNSSVYEMSDSAKREAKLAALKQNITTLRNRVNELGVAEPIIQQQGLERIVVQLPGVQDTARAKKY